MRGSLKATVQGSLRYKLLLLVALPFAITVPTMLGGTILWSRSFSYDQLYQRVTTDLAVAGDTFERIQSEYLNALASAGESYRLRVSLQENDDGQLLDIVELLAITAGFDYVHLSDAQGNWRFNSELQSGANRQSPLLERVLRLGLPAYGVEVYDAAELAAFDERLAQRAAIALIDSEHARPSTREHESRALVLRAIYPVRDRNGARLALLDAGVLLNRNFNFVDRIRNLVYGPGSLPDQGRGSVSVTLDDVRISTNALLTDNERALGTRESASVYRAVIDEGADRIARTFVVNDWYISAYTAIENVSGQRIGMLNTSVLEAPYRNAYLRAVSVLGGAILVAIVLLGLVLARGARGVLQPIESMMRVVRAIKQGQDLRIGPLASQDEIGELAREFDTMLELLAKKNRQIQRFADDLEETVTRRTSELRQKNEQLQATIDLLRETRAQLAVAEKLAALGELTAGVAHEINNPVAVILGNLEVLVRELGEHAAPAQTEIDLIVEQVDRIRSIVDRLLQYSRPAQYAGAIQPVDARALIEDTLLLANHELTRKGARLIRQFECERSINISRHELQQVLVNLIINAAHAIERGGEVTVSVRDWEGAGIVIGVHDNGAGIAADQLGRVFDPFYTSKPRGTGLGLSVSYGIVRHYGGRITVASEPGEWTRFEVYLWRDARYEDSAGPARGALPGTPDQGARQSAG